MLVEDKGLVSILIPVYNVANYIRPALDNVIAQQYQNFEVVLVNDGSTDESGAICQEYVNRDARFRLVTQHNQGFGAARNTGLQFARGEFVYFMDSDDLIEPTLLQDVIDTFREHPYNTVFFGFRKVYLQSNKSFDMVPPAIDSRDAAKSKEGLLEMLYKGFGFGVWQQVFRRSFLLESKISFPTLKREADVAFLLELYQNVQSFKTIPTVYYLYQAYYSSNKNNPDILVNHVILYRLLEKLVEPSVSNPLTGRILHRYFILWFCHVIPLHIYLSPNMKRADKWRAFSDLWKNPDFVRGLKNLKKHSNESVFQRMIVTAFGFKSTLIIYLVTSLNYFFKFKLRLNYKKAYYSNLSS